MDTSNYVSQWSKKYGTDPRCKESLEWIIKHSFHLQRDIKTYKPDEFYKYMLTFTIDPSKVDISCDSDKKVWIEYVDTYIHNLLFKNKTIYRAYYSREHDESNVHWHAIVHCHAAFDHKMLNYYKKTYGLVDVSRSKQLEDENSIKYLGKESEITHIKGEMLKSKTHKNSTEK